MVNLSWPYLGSPARRLHWMHIVNNYENSVIPYYFNLQKQFMEQYNQFMENNQQAYASEYLDDLINTVNTNPVEGQRAIVQEWINTIADQLVERITEGSTITSRGIRGGGSLTSSYSTRKKEIDAAVTDWKAQHSNIEKLAQKAKEQADRLYRQDVEALYTDMELAQQIKQTLIDKLGYSNEQLNGFSVQETMSQLRAITLMTYRGRLNRANFSRKQILGRRNTIAGYMREALVHKTFDEFMERIGHSGGAIHTAKYKESAENEMDEFITFLDDTVGTYNQVLTTTDRYSDNPGGPLGFGVQVKSWTVPWEQNDTNPFKRTYFHIGSRAQLLKDMDPQWKYSWLKTAFYLSYLNNAKQAIGPINTIFVTGDHIYWTADLIQRFRAESYYLAFVQRRNKETQTMEATSTIEWTLGVE